MKKVILKKQPTDVVELEEVRINFYYGVQYTEFQRGFITCQTFEKNFVVRASTMLTEGNGWSTVIEPSLKSLINKLLTNNQPVFEFSSFKELADWLTTEG